jgi:predicted MPP superfamily phosphohydrolase
METVTRRTFNRRRFLKGLGFAGIGLASTGVYGKTVESEWLEIGRQTIRLSKTPDQKALKILHLSDLHASEMVSLAFIERAIHLGLEQKPDLICLTGDYITRTYKDWDRYAKILSALPATAPTFATLGNHDGGAWCGKHIKGYSDTREVRQLLERGGIDLLDNSVRRVELQGWKLNLVGVGDIWANEFSPEKAFAKSVFASDSVTTVLSHNPDTKDQLQKYGWDLMLSGHTHGGQVCLPFIGAPVAPVKDKRFIKGLHRWDNRWIYVTKGIGNVFGVRINCRPEVSVLTLV